VGVQGEYFLSLYVRHASFFVILFRARCEIVDQGTVACAGYLSLRDIKRVRRVRLVNICRMK